MQARILLVDGAAQLLDELSRYLSSAGYQVSTASSRAQAVERLALDDPDLCILEYELRDGTGFDVIRENQRRAGKAGFVLLSGQATISLAVDAIKLGADQVLAKPVSLPSLGALVERTLRARSEKRQRDVPERAEQRQRIDPFVGRSEAIARVRELANGVLQSGTPVLLCGETGTGKGVLARWLHEHGPRAQQPFVDLNCAGLSRELAESELFGEQRKTADGGDAARTGLLDLAHGGSLFLDEIADLDLTVQPKLLKVLEDKRYRRIGDVQSRVSDIRLISSTHRDLTQLAERGGFRADLLFRINTVALRLPALRERQSDILALAQMLLEGMCREQGRVAPELGSDAARRLEAYDWPGNIRELRNVLERALLFCSGKHITEQLIELHPSARAEPVSRARATLAEVERTHIAGVMHTVAGKVEEAAKILGIPRSSLYAKLKRYGSVSSRGA